MAITKKLRAEIVEVIEAYLAENGALAQELIQQSIDRARAEALAAENQARIVREREWYGEPEPEPVDLRPRVVAVKSFVHRGNPGRGRKHLACGPRGSRVRAIRVLAGDRGLRVRVRDLGAPARGTPAGGNGILRPCRSPGRVPLITRKPVKRRHHARQFSPSMVFRSAS
jgi:hypothetical protein